MQRYSLSQLFGYLRRMFRSSSVVCGEKESRVTCVSAEHSTYFTALRSLASFSAVSGVMGFCLFLASFSMVDGSSRKSIWVPTSRKGVFGQWWVISGTHWSETDYKPLINTDVTFQDSIRYTNLRQKSPFLWHFQRKRGRQQRNRPGTHLSVDNSTAVICHNLPDLENAQIQLVKRSRGKTAGKFRFPIFPYTKQVMVNNMCTMEEKHTCCIKQTQSVGLSSDHDSDGVVIKHLKDTNLGSPRGHQVLQLVPLQRVHTLTVGTYSEGNLFVV